MGFAKNCFDEVVGLSRRDCNCYEDGRPEGETDTLAFLSRWIWEKFDAPDTPADPYVLTTEYDLPEEITGKTLVLYADGQLLNPAVDFEKTDDRELTITTPVGGATYQLWYKASISATVSMPAYNRSLSGLYIADLIPEEMMAGLYSCDGTIWAMYEQAKQIAIREFIAALNTNLMRRNRQRFNTWAGFLGEAKGTERLDTTKQYAGLRIRTNGMRSGYLRILRIGTLFETTGTIELTIYDGDGNVVTPTFEVSTAGNSKSFTSVNITLPLLGDFASEQDYYIVYSYDADNRGLQNKVFCKPCSQSAVMPTYNVETYKTFARNIRGATAWHNYIAIGGWEGDSVADFSDSPDTMGIYMNGLGLDIELGCDMIAGLCAMLQNFDANPYSNSVAVALQRKWAATIVGQMLRSAVPNRDLQVNREQLSKDVGQWEAETAEVITWLSTNVPENANDCIECRPRISTQGILT